jgi:hypothetical protein
LFQQITAHQKPPFNPDNPLGRHSGEGRNPAKKYSAKRTRPWFCLATRDFSINWIPAFAGMTTNEDVYIELWQDQYSRIITPSTWRTNEKKTHPLGLLNDRSEAGFRH